MSARADQIAVIAARVEAWAGRAPAAARTKTRRGSRRRAPHGGAPSTRRSRRSRRGAGRPRRLEDQLRAHAGPRARPRRGAAAPRLGNRAPPPPDRRARRHADRAASHATRSIRTARTAGALEAELGRRRGRRGRRGRRRARGRGSRVVVDDPGAERRFRFRHPTASGKTIAAAGFVEAARTMGVLILTHRRLLVSQFTGDLTDRGLRHPARAIRCSQGRDPLRGQPPHHPDLRLVRPARGLAVAGPPTSSSSATRRTRRSARRRARRSAASRSPSTSA